MIEYLIAIFMHMSQYKPFFGRFPLNIYIGMAAIAFLFWIPAQIMNGHGTGASRILRKVFLGLGLFSLYLFWSLAFPLYQTPDEQSHFAYVYHIAELGRLPITKIGAKNGERPAIPNEYEFSLIFHRNVNSVTVKHAFSDDIIGVNEEDYSLPRSLRKNTHAAASDEWWKIQNNFYPPLYYALGAGIYSAFRNDSFFARFWAVRLLSIILSLVAVLLTFHITGYIFPDANDRPLRRLVTALFALFPMYCQVAISINPNILEIVLYELYILAILSALRHKLSLIDVVSLTAIISAGMLTKQQFIGLFPLTAIFVVIRARKTGISALRRTCFLTIFVAGTLCLAGWWYAWFLITHGQFALFTNVTTLSVEAIAALRPDPVHYIFDSFAALVFSPIQSFWGNFSWRNLPIPVPVVYILSGMMITGLLAAGRKALAGDPRRKEIGVIGILIATYFLLVNSGFIVIGAAQMLAYGLQGRYFYPVLSSLLLLMSFGLFAPVPQKMRSRVFPALVAAMSLFNIYCLFGLIVPRFY